MVEGVITTLKYPSRHTNAHRDIMLRKGYVVRMALSVFLLGSGMILSFNGFVYENLMTFLIGTVIGWVGAALGTYTEMRRLTEALGK